MYAIAWLLFPSAPAWAKAGFGQGSMHFSGLTDVATEFFNLLTGPLGVAAAAVVAYKYMYPSSSSSLAKETSPSRCWGSRSRSTWSLPGCTSGTSGPGRSGWSLCA